MTNTKVSFSSSILVQELCRSYPHFPCSMEAPSGIAMEPDYSPVLAETNCISFKTPPLTGEHEAVPQPCERSGQDLIRFFVGTNVKCTVCNSRAAYFVDQENNRGIIKIVIIREY